MLHNLIVNKIYKLSQQIDKDSLAAIEKELTKINPTDATVYDFKAGFSDSDHFFVASFNVRALHVKHELSSPTSFADFFVRLMSKVRSDKRTLEIINETLDSLLTIPSCAQAKTYPALFLDDIDSSIACRFRLKKTYNEA